MNARFLTWVLHYKLWTGSRSAHLFVRRTSGLNISWSWRARVRRTALHWLIFQYFSILITIVSALVMIGMSYAPEAPDYEKLSNLTFGTTAQTHRTESQASWSWREVAISVFVVAVIAGGYLYFTG